MLPDYRVAVIGSKKKLVTRGQRKGTVTSDTDTPAERAEKWTRFQTGVAAGGRKPERSEGPSGSTSSC